MIRKTQHIKIWGIQVKWYKKKFITLNVYVRKQDRPKYDLRFYIRKLEKEEQNRPKVSRRK